MGRDVVAESHSNTDSENRRGFLARMSTAVMALGLTLGYGFFATVTGWFLYPAKASSRTWQFLTDLGSFAVGDSMTYVAPAGQRVVISRLSNQGNSEDFIALSSVCPHLGCQVHWETNNDRFFCPCHNGAFDKSGQPLSGPPKDSNAALPRYRLVVENGLLFIEVPTEALV